MEVRKKYVKYKMTALRSAVETVIFFTILIQLGIYYLRLVAFFFQSLEDLLLVVSAVGSW